MAWWFLRGVLHGVVTTTYPRRTDAWAAQLPTPPAFCPRMLTPELADRLVQVCPSGALRRDADILVLDLAACTACGACLDAAGAAAAPSGHWELATWDRSLLLRRIPIGRGRHD